MTGDTEAVALGVARKGGLSLQDLLPGPNKDEGKRRAGMPPRAHEASLPTYTRRPGWRGEVKAGAAVKSLFASRPACGAWLT